MEQYTIYCTEEQTRKALELGAPIELSNCAENVFKFWDGFTYIIPTAEQMIGWVEELEDIEEIIILRNRAFQLWAAYLVTNKLNKFVFSGYIYQSRKEAILAAIDAALEYLTNNKK